MAQNTTPIFPLVPRVTWAAPQSYNITLTSSTVSGGTVTANYSTITPIPAPTLNSSVTISGGSSGTGYSGTFNIATATQTAMTMLNSAAAGTLTGGTAAVNLFPGQVAAINIDGGVAVTSGSGTTFWNLGFTAGTNGSRVDFIKFRPLGTNAQTVARIFINNGSAVTTPSNNILFLERTLVATTVAQTTEQADILIPLNISLAAGAVIYASFGTAVVAGFAVSVTGGDY